MHRPIGRYQRPKHKKLLPSLNAKHYLLYGVKVGMSLLSGGIIWQVSSRNGVAMLHCEHCELLYPYTYPCIFPVCERRTVCTKVVKIKVWVSSCNRVSARVIDFICFLDADSGRYADVPMN